MEVWKSMAGMLVVELTSAEPEMALTAVNEAGIEIFQIQQKGVLTCSFRVRRGDYRRLEALCIHRGETLRVVNLVGFYWNIKALLHRPVLIAGILFLFTVILLVPTRILFVNVEGNETISEKQILAAAEECGICFGASRREVRSEKVKNALLSTVPQLQWAGVNTAGCVATISVRERTETHTSASGNEVANIVASRDGYILSGTVTQGNRIFQPGQTVKEGEILISGYNDCGLCIQVTKAEGEVFAMTERNVEAITPSTCLQHGELQTEKRKLSVLFRKKRINLWKDSGISDTSCGRMYEEYYVTLPGGFQLPIALCVETYVFCEMQETDIMETDAQVGLEWFAEEYLEQQMVAGEIRQRSQNVSLEDGYYCLTGEYVCVEMIGKEQRVQIGDSNG